MVGAGHQLLRRSVVSIIADAQILGQVEDVSIYLCQDEELLGSYSLELPFNKKHERHERNMCIKLISIYI